MTAPSPSERSPQAVDRRQFLALMRALGGLVLMASSTGAVGVDEKSKYGADAMPHGWQDDPLAFIAIGEDGMVTIVVHRSEMGQGVRTSMALIVADELEADWNRVRVIQANADEAKYGNQDTDGSRSVRHFFDPMRRAGAAARMMLEEVAAARWGVPVGEVHANLHQVLHQASGRKFEYGALARDAAKRPVPRRDSLRLKNVSEFRYIGKGSQHGVDGPDIVTGRAKYGIDVQLDGMLYAVVERSPVMGGTVLRFDATEALKVPGVVKVLLMQKPEPGTTFHPLEGVAVVAQNTWAALQARKLLQIEWTDSVHGHYDSISYRAQLERAARNPGQVLRAVGDVDGAFASASRIVEAEYYLPHIAHATMEPPAAVARITDGQCEVWAPTQAPQVTRADVAKQIGLPIEKVTVHVTLLGGGFGRKSKPDFVIEAAMLSKEMRGAPVKAIWTREDDLRHDYYHTVSVERLRAGLDNQGKVVGWLHRSVAPTIASIFGPDPQHEAVFEQGMGLLNIPFDIPNLRIENPEAAAHTRIGWFRSVSNIPHAFAIQCFVAELAAAAGHDHREFLLDLIGRPRIINPNDLKDSWNYGESPQRYGVDTGRLRRVVEVVTHEGGWGRTLPKGSGLGLAMHYSFLSYAAVLVQVQVSEAGELTIARVDIAFDSGPLVNPERVRAQLEGAVGMGMSLAMTGEITFRGGRAEQGNFHQYRVMRINESPREIHVHLVGATDWQVPLGGVGEPGIPPVAPALCNAIFSATGKRIRQLPIGRQLSEA